MEIGKPQRVDEVPEPTHQPLEFDPPVPDERELVPEESPAEVPVPAER